MIFSIEIVTKIMVRIIIGLHCELNLDLEFGRLTIGAITPIKNFLSTHITM